MANAAASVPAAARLIERARAEDVLLVHVNDNYGDWNTSASELAERALNGRHPELVEPLLPIGEAPFVTNARHSVFYATLLEYLLESEGVGRLVMTGQATEQCILYSALDAYVRHFHVTALEMMERNMHAEITNAEDAVFGV